MIIVANVLLEEMFVNKLKSQYDHIHVHFPFRFVQGVPHELFAHVFIMFEVIVTRHILLLCLTDVMSFS